MVSQGTARYTIDSGTFEVEADFRRVQKGYDPRSHAKRTLDALEAVIEGKAGDDVASYSIAGRSITKMAPSEVLKFYSVYKDLYRAEQALEAIKKGLDPGNRILARLD